MEKLQPIRIPDAFPCLFCGGVMERTGPTFLGSGVNSISYACTNCNAVCSHFCNHNRKITSIDHTFHYSDEEENSHG